MTARLNGREVNVLAVDPVMTFALVAGMRKTADVAEGELPPCGEAYIYQQPQEDERFLQVEYEMVSELAKAARMKIPSLRQISKFDGLVRFHGEYEMRRDEEDEWEAAFKSIEPLETPYELTEDNELVPLGEGVDEPIEQKRTHWRDFILPIPPPAKGASDELYLTLAYEFYDAIKAGTKTTEYRDYTPNWVKRTLSHPIRTVKFQRGYGGPGHPPPEQMIWTVKGVWLYESATKTKGDPSNPPQGIIPDCIAIDLGCRVG